MFTVSEQAQKAILAFFEENPDEERVLRVYLSPGTCNGTVLSITTDAVDPTDVSEEIAGVVFCMDKGLMERLGEVSISVNESGLVLKASRGLVNPGSFGDGCSCCGSCSCS